MRCLQAYLAIPYDFRAGIENVTIPVVSLIGGQSKLYDPNWQQEITRMLPNARDVILPRSGHAVPMDEPIGFHKVLKKFCENDLRVATKKRLSKVAFLGDAAKFKS